MQEQKCLVLRELLLLGIVKRGEFVLSSGRRSTIYVDMREALAYPWLRQQLFALLAVEVGDIIREVDVVAGIATGGVPWASLLANFYSKPLSYIRSGRKDHGGMKAIEGASVEGRAVLLVDDVATTGSSLLRGARIIREENGYVGYAVVLFDRGEGAKENLSRENIVLKAPLSMKHLEECKEGLQAIIQDWE